MWQITFNAWLARKPTAHVSSSTSPPHSTSPHLTSPPQLTLSHPLTLLAFTLHHPLILSDSTISHPLTTSDFTSPHTLTLPAAYRRHLSSPPHPTRLHPCASPHPLTLPYFHLTTLTQPAANWLHIHLIPSLYLQTIEFSFPHLPPNNLSSPLPPYPTCN